MEIALGFTAVLLLTLCWIGRPAVFHCVRGMNSNRIRVSLAKFAQPTSRWWPVIAAAIAGPPAAPELVALWIAATASDCSNSWQHCCRPPPFSLIGAEDRSRNLLSDPRVRHCGSPAIESDGAGPKEIPTATGVKLTPGFDQSQTPCGKMLRSCRVSANENDTA
jgi:hypothetical protein